MGGFCAKREQCGDYHSPNREILTPDERRCAVGEEQPLDRLAATPLAATPVEHGVSDLRKASRVYAIDPGTTESGWVLLDRGNVVGTGVDNNHDVLRWIKHGQSAHLLAIEMIAGMGMTVGQTTFDTCKWIGRFQQAWRDPDLVQLVLRRQVKTFLCGNQQAKDQNIRQALLDIFPCTGGGATPQIGTKAKPGPLYGVSSHAWSALAVAVTVCDQLKLKAAMPVMPQYDLAGVA